MTPTLFESLLHPLPTHLITLPLRSAVPPIPPIDVAAPLIRSAEAPTQQSPRRIPRETGQPPPPRPSRRIPPVTGQPPPPRPSRRIPRVTGLPPSLTGPGGRGGGVETGST